ncbi:Fic family protein [Enterococcus sp. CSURQ0835]|uniref:Fic family protein n=1 Tax=Enterococcus sp. CSURQ0835 TaxID=2681394 RepID=UPI00135B5C91|nr:Fic family protein [Enterococcus sp. CSURQ0835]
MNYANKYNLSREESIFLTKKTLVENIYSQAKMENINITFPDTKTILDGASVSGLNIDDVQKILNLRNAWRFVLDDLDAPLTLDYVTTLHLIVAYGELPPSMLHTLPTGDVSIGGSFYQPKVPDTTASTERIDQLLNRNVTVTEKALDYFLYACRAQLFWDGNKRTATIAANKLLIEAGAGVLIVNEKQLQRFNKLMIDYYETADKSRIKPFLYNHCIFGIDYK